MTIDQFIYIRDEARKLFPFGDTKPHTCGRLAIMEQRAGFVVIKIEDRYGRLADALNAAGIEYLYSNL